MADQSVRACHPSKFYYFRSPLISCCYVLFSSLSFLLHPHNSSIAIYPFPFTFALPFFLVSHGSLRLLLLYLFISLFSPRLLFGPSSTPGETREKDERGREKKRERALSECYVERNKTVTESQARLFWFRDCCVFSRAALLFSEIIRTILYFRFFETSRLHLFRILIIICKTQWESLNII